MRQNLGPVWPHHPPHASTAQHYFWPPYGEHVPFGILLPFGCLLTKEPWLRKSSNTMWRPSKCLAMGRLCCPLQATRKGLGTLHNSSPPPIPTLGGLKKGIGKYFLLVKHRNKPEDCRTTTENTTPGPPSLRVAWTRLGRNGHGSVCVLSVAVVAVAPVPSEY